MARKQFAGGAAKTSLSAGIASTDLALTVASGTGYPDGSVGPFVLVLGRETATAEKILCTSRTGNNFVVDAAGRGYDGTSAGAWTTGAGVEHCLDATTLTDLSAHVYDTTRDDHTQYLKTNGSRANTGVQAYSSTAGTTHESNRVDSTTQAYGRGLAVAADTAAFQGGVTAGVSIAINRAAPASSFANAGGDSIRGYAGATETFAVDKDGGLSMSAGAMANNATVGFFNIRTMSAAPNGLPSSPAGTVPMVFDSTNHKLWVWDGSWRGVVLA